MIDKKTTIQVTQKCKNRLDTYKKAIFNDGGTVTYEDLLNHFMDRYGDIESETLYEINKGDCKARFTIDYNTEELQYLDDNNSYCNLDGLKYSFEDATFQEEYNNFIDLISAISDDSQGLNLIDFASTLNVGESITIFGLTITRVG